MSDAVFIVIERFDGKKRYSQEYTLARADVHNKTVLSTLIFIKEHLDPTLNFTAACRMAICGACGVRLNGQPIIACDTSMEDQLALYATNRVTIAPLANFKVISDLVVDWEPALENLRKVHPSLMARKEFSKEKGCQQSAGDMEKIADMWDCILCGCCASSCNKLSVNRADYLEPFVFNIAARMSVDSRSKDPMIHAKPAFDNGLWKLRALSGMRQRMPQTYQAGGKHKHNAQYHREPGAQSGQRAGACRSLLDRHARHGPP